MGGCVKGVLRTASEVTARAVVGTAGRSAVKTAAGTAVRTAARTAARTAVRTAARTTARTALKTTLVAVRDHRQGVRVRSCSSAEFKFESGFEFGSLVGFGGCVVKIN